MPGFRVQDLPESGLPDFGFVRFLGFGPGGVGVWDSLCDSLVDSDWALMRNHIPIAQDPFQELLEAGI